MEELEKQQVMMKIRRDNLKDAMVEEHKTAHFNRMKILTHWRRIMRVAKTEELKREIQIYQQNHDREVDAKDAIIYMLDRDLEESEEQFQMALKNHKIRIDQLISIQKSRLEGLKMEFERDLGLLKCEFVIEKSDIEKGHAMEKQELCDMIETIEEEEMTKLDEIQKQFQEEREQTKNSKIEELESMKHTLIKKIELLDQNFEISFSNYVSETEANSTKYTQQLEQNDRDSKEITQLMRGISRVKERIQNLMLKQQQNRFD
jgi:dynein regulatory complex subunit 2